MKLALYTTAKIYGPKQTGGIKRFAELTEYASKNLDGTIIYSGDDSEVISEIGISQHVKLRDVNRSKLLPPETRKLLSNIQIIKHIKKIGFEKTVIFDVPTAIGPLLYGLENVVLMIRKDMIGYEKVQNKSKLKWLKIGFQWICESICMSRAKLIITQCNNDKEVLKDRHPLLAKKIEKKTVVQINNVNPLWIEQKSERADDNENILDVSDKFRICFIGFGNPRKGQDLLLTAAKDMLKERNDVQFIVVGGGRRLEEYQEKFNSDDIKFLGHLENPIVILKQCDMLVVPSYADSCPNTVMEALYNGVPVIGSNAGGIPEILMDEKSLFNLDADSIKMLIQAYLNDNKALQELKERQKRRKEELTFDWSKRIFEIISEHK